jgi:hypothetical protein
MPELRQTCPVCETEPTEVQMWGPHIRVTCLRCGIFALARSVFDDLPVWFREDPSRTSRMSYTIRRMQRQGPPPIIHPNTVETYWVSRLPTPNEQANELILWIGDHQVGSAKPAVQRELALDAWIGAVLPLKPGSASGLRWLIDAVEPSSGSPTLFTRSYSHGEVTLQLTLAGWKRHAELKHVQKASRTAFMAMKFGDAELVHAVNHCFRPAVRRTGFELRVLTDQQEAGLIDDQIRAALVSARFVLADLTHGNPGAYWEAGFADGRGLPVIYTCRRAEWDRAKTHFDTNHMLTVVWDPTDLMPSEKQIAATIRATLRAEATQADD